MRKLQITYSLIAIAKYLVVIGAILSVGFFIFLPNKENAFVGINDFQPFLGDIYWEIRGKELKDNLHAKLPPLNEPMVINVKRVGIALPITLTRKAISIVMAIFYSGYVFLLLHLTQAIVLRIKLGDFFNRLNTKQLKQVGLLVTFAPFLESLINSSYMSWIGFTYQAEGMRLHSANHLGSPVVILGLLITALALAFDHGAKMKEEQELTI
ncbi:DUF2975 domain-containing protein [Marinoscillum pacificum]|uniref:DUF2975 domain-containing protein n=1 Tax=Marinoscillum pacificum TaxID=392723 RepID=UPI0021586726|nr:DUF2975 domain-containing protein [Marinoscillum pacificum]